MRCGTEGKTKAPALRMTLKDGVHGILELCGKTVWASQSVSSCLLFSFFNWHFYILGVRVSRKKRMR